MCYVYLRDMEQAKDATQETFLKAYKSLASFRGDCSEKSWLVRIAINTCRMMKTTLMWCETLWNCRQSWKRSSCCITGRKWMWGRLHSLWGLHNPPYSRIYSKPRRIQLHSFSGCRWIHIRFCVINRVYSTNEKAHPAVWTMDQREWSQCAIPFPRIKAYTVYGLYRNTVYAFLYFSPGGCKTKGRLTVSSSLTAYSDCYPSGRDLGTWFRKTKSCNFPSPNTNSSG